MDLGWVMFWKAVVLAGIGAIGVAWAVAVEREKANLTFRKDRKGVYRAFAPLSAVDGWWQAAWPWIRRASYVMIFALWIALGGSYVIGGKEGAREMAFSILRGLAYLTS